MATHGENIGSRKVEPETNGLPKWRLKANYVMRELARTWYGKDSALPFPVDPHRFEHLLIEVLWQFVEDHSIRGSSVLEMLRHARKEFEAIHGREIEFKDWIDRFDWMIEAGLPAHLHKEFSRDELIQDILRTIEWLIHYATDEEEKTEPPLPSMSWLKPLEHYEALPVLPPTPHWCLLVNEVERELAYVWHGHRPYNPNAIRGKLMKALFEYADYMRDYSGEGSHEASKRLKDGMAEFESRHGFCLEFKTPAREIIWMAKTGLPLPHSFLCEPRVKRVLRAFELIHILSKAKASKPYSLYSVVFQNISHYDNLQPSKFSWDYDED
jgi:hypothetical protein